VSEPILQVAGLARDGGDGRFLVVCDASAATLARRIRRERGAIGTMTVDIAGVSLSPIEKIHAALRRRAATRRTAVVACGGGALLDAARIASALYDGGAPIVLVATTLGAAIDRAVDPVARRGTVEIERAPVASLVDYNAIPKSARDGLSTLIRDAVVEGDEFFDGMETLAPHPLRKWPWESVIDDALRVDRMHLGDDRRILELGMPFASAIVATHAISPQHALALGIRAACLAGRRVASFGERDHLRVLAVLALLGFSLHHPDIDAEAVMEAIPAGTRFALPHAIGDVEADIAVPRQTLRRTIARLTTTPGAAEFR
jgi:3-dehydroquinate synthetase